MLGDAGMPEGGSSERKLSDGHLVKIPSVAAQKFKRNVSEEPTASPMFSDISVEEPRRSEHAASLYQQVGSGHSSGSMGHRGSEDSGTVRFTVGELGTNSLSMERGLTKDCLLQTKLEFDRNIWKVSVTVMDNSQ